MDEDVEKVVLEDLHYRIDQNNYNDLTITLLNRIQAYREAYAMLNKHLSVKAESDDEDFTRSAVETDCCGKIVYDYSRYCPACGKKIDKCTARHLRYKFDKEATRTMCRHCGAWMFLTDHYCTECGYELL